jgi:di/tripeptidase
VSFYGEAWPKARGVRQATAGINALGNARDRSGICILSDPLVEAARAACQAILGTDPARAVFPGTTDASWFIAVHELPTLPALGPGLLRRAHAADEWVSITAVRQAVELYTHLASAYCSGGAIPAAHEEIRG